MKRASLTVIIIAGLALISMGAWTIIWRAQPAPVPAPEIELGDAKKLANDGESAAIRSAAEDQSTTIDKDLIAELDDLAEKVIEKVEKDSALYGSHVITPEMKWVEQPSDTVNQWTGVSPDGRFRATMGYEVGTREPNSFIRLEDTASGEVRILRANEINGSGAFYTFVDWLPDSGALLAGLSRERNTMTFTERRAKKIEILKLKSKEERREALNAIRTKDYELHRYEIGSDSWDTLLVSERTILGKGIASDGTVYAAVDAAAGDDRIRIYEFGDEMKKDWVIDLGAHGSLAIIPETGDIWYTERVENFDPSVPGKRDRASTFSIRSASLYDPAADTRTIREGAILLALTDDGAQYVFQDAMQSDGQYFIGRHDGGPARQIMPGKRSPRPVAFSSDGKSLILSGTRNGILAESDRRPGGFASVGLYEIGVEDALRAD